MTLLADIENSYNELKKENQFLRQENKKLKEMVQSQKVKHSD